MSNEASSLLNSLMAENLLHGTSIIAQITALSEKMVYHNDGKEYTFDEYYEKLDRETEQVSRLDLLRSIAPGTESQYQIQLATAMERVNSDCARMTHRILHFKAKLSTALAESKKVSASFTAWYILAATAELKDNPAKLPQASIKALAESEFSRLFSGIHTEIESTMEALKVQLEQIKEHKKSQQEKYSMGKDQANASWTGNLPDFGTSSDPGAAKLSKKGMHQPLPSDEEDDGEPEGEEPEESIPLPFVSKTSGAVVSSVTNGGSTVSFQVPGTVFTGTYTVPTIPQPMGPPTTTFTGFVKTGQAQPATPIAVVPPVLPVEDADMPEWNETKLPEGEGEEIDADAIIDLKISHNDNSEDIDVGQMMVGAMLPAGVHQMDAEIEQIVADAEKQGVKDAEELEQSVIDKYVPKNTPEELASLDNVLGKAMSTEVEVPEEVEAVSGDLLEGEVTDDTDPDILSLNSDIDRIGRELEAAADEDDFLSVDALKEITASEPKPGKMPEKKEPDPVVPPAAASKPRRKLILEFDDAEVL